MTTQLGLLIVQLVVSVVLAVGCGVSAWQAVRGRALLRAEIQELREQVSRVARGMAIK